MDLERFSNNDNWLGSHFIHKQSSLSQLQDYDGCHI